MKVKQEALHRNNVSLAARQQYIQQARIVEEPFPWNEYSCHVLTAKTSMQGSRIVKLSVGGMLAQFLNGTTHYWSGGYKSLYFDIKLHRKPLRVSYRRIFVSNNCSGEEKDFTELFLGFCRLYKIEIDWSLEFYSEDKKVSVPALIIFAAAIAAMAFGAHPQKGNIEGCPGTDFISFVAKNAFSPSQIKRAFDEVRVSLGIV